MISINSWTSHIMKEVDKWNNRDKTQAVYYVDIPQRHFDVLLQRAALPDAKPQRLPKWVIEQRIGMKPTTPVAISPQATSSDLPMQRLPETDQSPTESEQSKDNVNVQRLISEIQDRLSAIQTVMNSDQASFLDDVREALKSCQNVTVLQGVLNELDSGKEMTAKLQAEHPEFAHDYYEKKLYFINMKMLNRPDTLTYGLQGLFKANRPSGRRGRSPTPKTLTSDQEDQIDVHDQLLSRTRELQDQRHDVFWFAQQGKIKCQKGHTMIDSRKDVRSSKFTECANCHQSMTPESKVQCTECQPMVTICGQCASKRDGNGIYRLLTEEKHDDKKIDQLPITSRNYDSSGSASAQLPLQTADPQQIGQPFNTIDDVDL